MAQLQGAIKFFLESKGYGFIIPEDRSADVYFQRSQLKGAWMLCNGSSCLRASPSLAVAHSLDL